MILLFVKISHKIREIAVALTNDQFKYIIT